MRKILALLLAVCTVLCLTACASTPKQPSATDAPSFPTSPATEPTKDPARHTFDTSIQYNYFDILMRYGKTMSTQESLNIPVYSEDILFLPGNLFCLTRDTSANFSQLGPSFMENYYIHNVLECYPNELRVRSDCSSYAVYDTDTGYRLYLFFVPKYSGAILTGYPIVISKNKPLLSYSDFKSIQIGDPIEKVEAIDDVTTLYKKQLAKWDYEDSKYYENMAKKGNPVSSIHYLNNGRILRIEYKMYEKPNLVVSNITYFSSTLIQTADGETVDHGIIGIDLPVS